MALPTPSTALAQEVDASENFSELDFAELPVLARYDIGVRLSDGVRLSGNIFRPAGEGPFPTVFTHTPYNNSRTLEQAWQFVARGYAFVVVDGRGRHDSEGEFFPYRDDGPDGNEVMDWIARQPWSDGRIVTFGGSYTGKNQWLMAKENSPHHVAIVSSVAGADEFHDGARFDGVPKLDLRFTWIAGQFGPRQGWDWPGIMWHLPVSEMDRVAGRHIGPWQELMGNDLLNQLWEPMQMRGSYDRFDIPSWNVTGWWDGQLRGQVQHYREAVATGSGDDHMLIIGPWLHGVNRNRQVGERDYGPQAIIHLDQIRDEWMDHRVLGAPRPDRPNVLYFVQGRNEWGAADGWPVPGTRFTEFYLGSGGSANTGLGDGVLQQGRPGQGPADEFRYDPADPVPTLSSRTSGARGGIAQGSVDNRSVQMREDVLVYTSEPLAEGMEVTGPVTARIYFSTDVPDTDITVKLLEVQPDGRALNLTHGIARARFRNSYERPELLEPDQVYSVDVELYPTSNYFAAGKRIRVEVSSSNFPNLGRNLNTGQNSETTREMRVATTRIHHVAEHPSHILLPVIPAGTVDRWDPEEDR